MNTLPTTFDHRAFTNRLTPKPGVYQMLDAQGDVLYVGKARHLKKRVSSYFRISRLDAKTMALVKKIADIEITVTNNETEALLLEHNLIKHLRPPFNILFRDDKSYPYIYMSGDQPYPSFKLHRGAKPRTGRLFGPYPSISTVRRSLALIQKLFGIRNCENSFFHQRTRACLQHQIGRCSAPCVALIEPDRYAEQTRHAIMMLEGKGAAVLDELKNAMDAASNALDFETAARCRDQIRTLSRAQEEQHISSAQGDSDVVVFYREHRETCITMLYVRGGQVLGQKNWFPKNQLESPPEAVLSAFLSQFYLSQQQSAYGLPREIILNAQPEDAETFSAALEQQNKCRLKLITNPRGDRARWRDLAEMNAKMVLESRLDAAQIAAAQLESLTERLSLPEVPKRMECFDISHTRGRQTVASCVVFGSAGPIKDDYRRFNITGITGGDDYAAMRQALERHYRRTLNEGHPLPDLLFVDGGQGQITIAKAVLEKLGLGQIKLIGIAKEPGRKVGLERLMLSWTRQTLRLAENDPALKLAIWIRDEAHRFAITGHRKQRAKTMRTSQLEGIPGIGPKKRRELLRRFGGLKDIQNVSIAELAKTPGISQKLAQTLYDALHAAP